MVAGLGRGPFVPAVGLQAYGGAIADVPDGATAFSHRDALFEISAGFGWTDPAEDAARIAAARAYGTALERFASGAYVNALGDEGAGGVRRAYPPEKFARLAAVKGVWDPDNVFRLNANIRPVLAGAASCATVRVGDDLRQPSGEQPAAVGGRTRGRRGRRGSSRRRGRTGTGATCGASGLWSVSLPGRLPCSESGG